MSKATQTKSQSKTIPQPPEIQEVISANPNHVIVNPIDHPQARWFIVHTSSGHENRVAEAIKQRAQTLDLTHQILEMLIPTQEKIQIKRGQRKTVKEKIFPGYLLIKLVLTDQAWLTVRTTQGVTGFVGIGNKPTPLSNSEVKSIQKYMTQAAPSYKADFVIDQAVKITDGPFLDFVGTVSDIDEDKGKVTVLVSIFGRETPVELDFLQVEKI